MKYVLIILLLVVGFIGYSINTGIQSLNALSEISKPVEADDIKLNLAPTLSLMLSNRSPAGPDNAIVVVPQDQDKDLKEVPPPSSLSEIKSALANLSKDRGRYDDRYELMQVLQSLDNLSPADEYDLVTQELKSTLRDVQNITSNEDTYNYVALTHMLSVQSSQDEDKALELTIEAIKSTKDKDLHRVFKSQFSQFYSVAKLEEKIKNN